jgi:Holliday junction resolvasome RuvABC endonuclease subunit
MLKILSLAIPKIVAQSPCVKYEHDYETQHKINILNEEIQKVIDIYKNRYPELFRSID